MRALPLTLTLFRASLRLLRYRGPRLRSIYNAVRVTSNHKGVKLDLMGEIQGGFDMHFRCK